MTAVTPRESRAIESASVIWRRLDAPGHDAAILRGTEGGWRIEGTAVFVHGRAGCCLHYVVDTDSRWQTVSSRVCGWIGQKRLDLEIMADAQRRWTLNDSAIPGVTGCMDVDLAFTPATNLLPIRRLALAVGDSSDVSAAWLTFPDVGLERLEQTYVRLGETTYSYQSLGGSFRTTLQVLPGGFVFDYPDLWRIEPLP